MNYRDGDGVVHARVGWWHTDKRVPVMYCEDRRAGWIDADSRPSRLERVRDPADCILCLTDERFQ
jgi:hypothetical protein